MDPYSQEYMDLYTYVASLTPEVKAEMLRWEKERKALLAKISGKGNPCNPCNPCAAKRNPCNPCGRR